MSRRKPRGLSREDLELWQQVTKSAHPMRPKTPDKPAGRAETVNPKPPRADIPRFQIGQQTTGPSLSIDTAHDISARLSQAPVRMDRKAFARLRKGKLDPEGRIDLHGMTLSQAHPALVRFILSAHAAGKRLVLVITGKGRDTEEPGPMPVRRGVLRHQVPHWLSEPPLANAVLQVTQAHRKHGGGGAYYVYLRRS